MITKICGKANIDIDNFPIPNEGINDASILIQWSVTVNELQDFAELSAHIEDINVVINYYRDALEISQTDEWDKENTMATYEYKHSQEKEPFIIENKICAEDNTIAILEADIDFKKRVITLKSH